MQMKMQYVMVHIFLGPCINEKLIGTRIIYSDFMSNERLRNRLFWYQLL